jgi:hypothetical protein
MQVLGSSGQLHHFSSLTAFKNPLLLMRLGVGVETQKGRPVGRPFVY